MGGAFHQFVSRALCKEVSIYHPVTDISLDAYRVAQCPSVYSRHESFPISICHNPFDLPQLQSLHLPFHTVCLTQRLHHQQQGHHRLWRV